jgi:hypothetical protein
MLGRKKRMVVRRRQDKTRQDKGEGNNTGRFMREWEPMVYRRFAKVNEIENVRVQCSGSVFVFFPNKEGLGGEMTSE